MKRFAKLVAFCVVAATTLGVASAAHAQETPIEQADPVAILEFPVEPQVTSSVTVGAEGATGATANTDTAAEGDVVFSVDLGGDDGPRVPSQSVVLIILITLLSVAPALLIMMTSFTRVVIVFTLLRNALGLPTAPPNQVLVGLSLFISLFIMAPTLSEAWNEGVKPFTEGALEQSEAFDAESLAQEISCMQRIEHPNCVMLHEVDPPNVPSISAKCPRDRLMWVLVALVQRAREGDCACVRRIVRLARRLARLSRALMVWPMAW